jgi:hypothetical protein
MKFTQSFAINWKNDAYIGKMSIAKKIIVKAKEALDKLSGKDPDEQNAIEDSGINIDGNLHCTVTEELTTDELVACLEYIKTDNVAFINSLKNAIKSGPSEIAEYVRAISDAKEKLAIADAKVYCVKAAKKTYSYTENDTASEKVFTAKTNSVGNDNESKNKKEVHFTKSFDGFAQKSEKIK